ncbi:MAG: hypothetical protein ACREYE_20845 [Gammaproteobacteria bacterium]
MRAYADFADRPTTGKLDDQLVKSNNPGAPFAPLGIVVGDNGTLYVADLGDLGNAEPEEFPGRIAKYDSETGEFLGNLTVFDETKGPRGLVFGPDGLLYASLRTTGGLGGEVRRFNVATEIGNVFINDAGGSGKLNRPEGLVFNPDDGFLYITSFRADTGDTDSIRIYDNSGVFVDKIDLYQVGIQPRVFAQALLFGPEGKLFVPITGGAPLPDGTPPPLGQVRGYDVGTKNFDAFVPSGGPLKSGWYLTFGNTNAGTLAYEP